MTPCGTAHSTGGPALGTLTFEVLSQAGKEDESGDWTGHWVCDWLVCSSSRDHAQMGTNWREGAGWPSVVSLVSVFSENSFSSPALP